jgi:hypothetical protein
MALDFSVFLQDPRFRAIVQDGVLERAFHDSLYPALMFRQEADPQPFPGHVGDSMVFSAPGLMKTKQRPLKPGDDVQPSQYGYEQWRATVQKYADAIDTDMPTNYVAIVDLLMRNMHQLGLGGAQTLNRIVRNRMYAAAESGWTVARGLQSSVTSLAVHRLNGFTTARRPDLAAGSQVAFAPVSATNPLPITVNTTTGPAVVNVTGFTSVTAGDEVGPGTLTIDSAVSVADRAYIQSSDATSIVRVGGALQVDGITSADIASFAAIRTAVARFRTQNVPAMPDRRFHCHMDPTWEAQLFADDEMQRVNTALPDYYIYKEFSAGEILGCLFVRNSECPLPETVTQDSSQTDSFSQDDPFAGELYSNGLTGVKLHRGLFVGQSSIYEYYADLDELISEAGVTGEVGYAKIVNNGIDVMADRIQMIIRGPLDRLQEKVSSAYKFIGDWPVRTDAAVGDSARFKRLQLVISGE